MAIETKVIAITTSAYVQIGASVTSITARARNGHPFSVVVVAPAGGAPLVGETDIVTAVDGKFQMSGTAGDVYALATEGDTNLEILRV